MSCIFQKHELAGLSSASTVRLKEKRGSTAEYLLVKDAAGVLELVQFNVLEFHPWGAKASSPERTERVVFDLDPGPGVEFVEIKKAAQHIRKLLQRQLELEPFVRAAGGKGLHVVVPLDPSCDWALTKRFAHGSADALARSQPDRSLAKASKKLRDQRI